MSIIFLPLLLFLLAFLLFFLPYFLDFFPISFFSISLFSFFSSSSFFCFPPSPLSARCNSCTVLVCKSIDSYMFGCISLSDLFVFRTCIRGGRHCIYCNVSNIQTVRRNVTALPQGPVFKIKHMTLFEPAKSGGWQHDQADLH